LLVGLRAVAAPAAKPKQNKDAVPAIKASGEQISSPKSAEPQLNK
jgi:hypothetical protein